MNSRGRTEEPWNDLTLHTIAVVYLLHFEEICLTCEDIVCHSVSDLENQTSTFLKTLSG